MTRGLPWEGMLWVIPWAVDRARRALVRARPGRHLLVALCDHFEPLHGGVDLAQGVARSRAWATGYPALAADFADDDGRPPRHTFFFPGEQYHPRLVEPLAGLCERGLAEVEVHLHHDRDTSNGLRGSLDRAVRDLATHGLVTYQASRPRWAFIHGNWCLANARRDGRHCGVDDELAVLNDAGCYADFTFPCAPDPSQPWITNAIWYPRGDVHRRRAHVRPARVAVGSPGRSRVLLISGPLALSRKPGRRRPRVDAAAVTAADPATPSRVATWIESHVHVAGRPEWVFVKLHTHGAPEAQARALLGPAQRAFHEHLQALRLGGYALHYVTAREMYNLARAAMDGAAGPPDAHRDWEIAPPPRAGGAHRAHVEASERRS